MLNQYLAEKAISIIIVMLSTSIAFGLIYADIFYLLRKMPGFFRLLSAAALTAFVFLLPQYIVDYLYSPEMFDIVNDSILLFPLPFFVPMYYLVNRKVFGLSKAYAVRIIEETFTAQYMTMLMFKLFSSMWQNIFMFNTVNWQDAFNGDLLSMVSTITCGGIFYLCVRLYVKKKGGAIPLPYGYPEPKIKVELFKIFISVSSNYIIIVAINTLLLIRRRSELNISHAVLYAVMFLVLAYRMSDSIRKRRMGIMSWQKTATGEYIQSLITINNNFRSIRHDFYNILQVYGGYIATGNLDAMKKYHNDVTRATQHSDNAFRLLDLLKERPAIYTVLELKFQRAEKLNVEIELYEVSHIVKIPLSDLDACRVFSNLLDNAIEAASLSEGKHVTLKCRNFEDKIQVELSNTTSSEVDTAKIYTPGFTTKEKHTGMGLNAVASILEANENTTMGITFSNNRFIVYLQFDTS